MRCVCSQHHPPNAEFRRAPLMHAIGTDVRHVILARDRVAGQDLLESHRLALNVLLSGEAGDVGVGDAVETVGGDAGGHVEIFRVNHIVNVGVGVFGEVVVYLVCVSMSRSYMWEREWEGEGEGGKKNTFVAISCAFNVSPGNSDPNSSRRTVLPAPSQPRT